MTFDEIFRLEDQLCQYTGAPYVVVTDGCTHAIELCLRWYKIKKVSFSAYTYISIPQTMLNMGIEYTLTDETWIGEYQFHGTNIWDSARRLEPGMYRSGQIQCLSFGNGKPLSAGKCGAILLDDQNAHHYLSRMRSDGRDLHVSPWINQEIFSPGWHYCPTLETVAQVQEKLKTIEPKSQQALYPDCRKISIYV
jgi:dTDP-4-amino-4,6-dideoxygalactose transaminase